MKQIIFALTAVIITSCNGQEKQFSQDVKSQKLIDQAGAEIAFDSILKKHKGKTVLIEVWASWCGDCVKAMPMLKETQAANPEVDYIFISMDKTAEKWKEGIAKHDLKGEHYWTADGMKGAFGKSIELDWIPRYIILDKNGDVVIYRAIEKDFEKINATLKSKTSEK